MIRDVDKGAKALLKKMGMRKSVRVGVMGSEAEAGHKGSDLTVVDIATFHEFGYGVPKRSFIADYVDGASTEIGAKIQSIAERVVRGADFNAELARLGLVIQGEIQQRIANGIDPPLADSTVRRKGSSKPLIDTGQLRSSITYEVIDG